MTTMNNQTRVKRGTYVIIRRGDLYAAMRAWKYPGRKLGFLGGKVEEGETHEVAATREVRQEGGVDVFNLQRFRQSNVADPNNPDVLYDGVGFCGEISPDAQLVSSDEGEVFWTTREDILAHAAFPDLPDVFMDYDVFVARRTLLARGRKVPVASCGFDRDACKLQAAQMAQTLWRAVAPMAGLAEPNLGTVGLMALPIAHEIGFLWDYLAADAPSLAHSERALTVSRMLVDLGPRCGGVSRLQANPLGHLEQTADVKRELLHGKSNRFEREPIRRMANVGWDEMAAWTMAEREQGREWIVPDGKMGQILRGGAVRLLREQGVAWAFRCPC